MCEALHSLATSQFCGGYVWGDMAPVAGRHCARPFFAAGYARGSAV